jgi:hypothetical protein
MPGCRRGCGCHWFGTNISRLEASPLSGVASFWSLLSASLNREIPRDLWLLTVRVASPPTGTFDATTTAGRPNDRRSAHIDGAASELNLSDNEASSGGDPLGNVRKPRSLSSRAEGTVADASKVRPSSECRVRCSSDAQRFDPHFIAVGHDRGAPRRMGAWCIVSVPRPPAVGRLRGRFKCHAGAPGLLRSCWATRRRSRPGCRRVTARSNGTTRRCAGCCSRAGWTRCSRSRGAHRLDCSLDPVGTLQRP